MKDNRFVCFLRSLGVWIAVWLLLVGLAQTTAFSRPRARARAQCPPAPRASVRGTALVQNNLVVGGITVVAIATDPNGRRCGSVRAPVSNAGEYRFDNIASGKYTFVATGTRIKQKVIKTEILPGDENEVNLSLETAKTQARLRILDSSETPVTNASSGIYASTSSVVYKSPASARGVKAHHQ